MLERSCEVASETSGFLELHEVRFVLANPSRAVRLHPPHLVEGRKLAPGNVLLRFRVANVGVVECQPLKALVQLLGKILEQPNVALMLELLFLRRLDQRACSVANGNESILALVNEGLHQFFGLVKKQNWKVTFDLV